MVHAQSDAMKSSERASDKVFQISELLEAILCHLRDDTLSLSSCTLACKSWDAIASRHLFEFLSIDPLLYFLRPSVGTSELVSNVIVCEPKYFSLKQSSRVTSQVRDLSFGVSRSDDRDTSIRVFDSGVLRLAAVPIEVLGDVVSTFPALRALHIGWLRFIEISTLQALLLREGCQYVAAALCSPSHTSLDAITLELDTKPSELARAYTKFPGILSVFPNTLSISFVHFGKHPWPATASAHPSRPVNDHRRLGRSPSWFQYEPRSHNLHPWTLPRARQLQSTGLEHFLLLDYAPYHTVRLLINDLLRRCASDVGLFAFAVGEDVVNSSIATHGHSISAKLKLDLSQCSQLHTVHLGIWLHPYIPENTFAAQNAHLWQPTVGTVLTAPPDTIRDVHICLALHEDNFDLGPDFDLVSAMRALLHELDYNLLGRIVDKHRCLRKMEIIFLSPMIPSLTDAERLMRARLPSELTDIVRFSSRTKQQFYEAISA